MLQHVILQLLLIYYYELCYFLMILHFDFVINLIKHSSFFNYKWKV